jgi:ABC-type bacteriocin/lantibiotic exporter with double-glycine peptidase domain
MLASYYSLPIRRDNLRRAGQFLADSKGGASLEQVINVVDQLGLDGRVVVFRPKEASRLPTPAVILDGGHNPSLIVEANGSGLLLLNPASTIQRIPQQNLVDHFGPNLRAVAVSSGRNTPQKRFGLAWVLPYLRVQNWVGGGVYCQFPRPVVCPGHTAFVPANHRPGDWAGIIECAWWFCGCDGAVHGAGTDFQ